MYSLFRNNLTFRKSIKIRLKFTNLFRSNTAQKDDQQLLFRLLLILKIKLDFYPPFLAFKNFSDRQLEEQQLKEAVLPDFSQYFRLKMTLLTVEI